MNSPAVSILLTVRNEEEFLPAALASLQRQTFTDWELVAVDDGSTDRTPQLLAAAALDPRVRLLTLPPQGLVSALNSGLAACRAPLVARMDGDDVCHPQRLARQWRYLQNHPECLLVASRVRHFPRPRLAGGMRDYERWQNSLLDDAAIRRDLYVESPFAHPSVMFRTGQVLAAGGYRDLGWAEDYDLWLRLARRPGTFARLPEPLLFWRDRDRRLTRTSPACSPAAFRACKIHHLRQTFLAGATQVTLWGAGTEGKAWRKSLAEAGIAVSGWVEVDRRKIGQVIHKAPVVAVDALQAGGARILVTIGARGAREQVREWSRQRGLVEGRDFLCVT
ncbi:glycosyltransferase [Desulfuromonas carbonis]|uniref:glycosyltransferase family 2 protein n=1 Tax=Desulfuromonas sp. DDH964 TaxID=1823759 RepID=UPI00078E34CE|nr:glycosyltransferase [Desulfuromonas sp. DDH964]AMV72590.1 AmsE-like family glycosyltransferase [Desulfuromonas sp. DDH964]